MFISDSKEKPRSCRDVKQYIYENISKKHFKFSKLHYIKTKQFATLI